MCIHISHRSQDIWGKHNCWPSHGWWKHKGTGGYIHCELRYDCECDMLAFNCNMYLQPPRLCYFQSASYVMSFTSDNETWSRDTVAITDTTQSVKEDIETGFVLNKHYTVTITVIMEHGNVTSSANFSEWCGIFCHILSTFSSCRFCWPNHTEDSRL